MGVKWTSEQQKVIDLRNRNILVSAAAGSGKTAVLVERIIQMLTDEDNPVNVDKLLIVTFTEAAAAEMKERIREAVEKKLEEHPGNVHLQRQATLIHSAQITTIHSFCLSVIRDHFHVLDIDPGFRIGEEGELKLLKQDVLDELLEERYIDAGTDFLEFVEKFSTGRNDKKIEEVILKLYEYSRSYPQPDVWLESCAKSYETEAENSSCIERVEELVRQKSEDMLYILDEGLRVCDMPDGPYMYGEMLESDKLIFSNLLKAENFEAMYQRIQGISWKRLSTKKDETVDRSKRERVKALREKVKKMAKDITETYFYEEPEEIFLDMEESADTMRVITGLVKEFAAAFSEKKQSKNMIDFSDMEQFAMQILTEEGEDGLVPSPAAKEYQERFVEVMIDEYQDSNLIQEAILTSVSTVSKGENNIFMVGDVKQSIYRFRLSRPELFMEKYDTYSQEEGSRQRIDLHKNFRSREEVLTSVNFIFEQIMRKELGGILYDEEAALCPGASYEPQTDGAGESIYQTELLLVDTSEPEIKEAADAEPEERKQKGGIRREMEARAVARRIKELLQSGRVLDKASGAYRAPKYGDIVILTRSIKGWADVFAAVLGEEGIPAYAGSREGYFETYEVSVLLDYLKILDNFMQELPLTAILTSPFVGLEAEQLAAIRNAYPDMAFHEAVLEYASGESYEGHLQDVLKEFLETLNHFREMVPYTAIHDLLWHIIEDTGYGTFIAAMPGGAQRTANVEMLVEKAAAFEGTSYKGLFNFVRYIGQLKKYDVDYGEANIADEQSDTVRIMTIHKSKGLEFPIVFVCGMGKQFNTQDVKSSIVIHPKWGVGIDAIDLEKRTKIPTILKKVIQEEIMRESLGEELRVLYVALTRAKEKLIITGELSDAAEVLEQYQTQNHGEKGSPLPYYVLAGARSYLDWILPVIPKLSGEVPFQVHVADCWNVAVSDCVETQTESLARDVLEHWNTDAIYHPQLHSKLKEQLEYSYPYEEEGRLKMKFTVSELKKHTYLSEEAGEELYEEPEVIPLLPRFLKEETKLTGASRGSAYHKLLELLDFAREYNEETLEEETVRLETQGKLSKDMAESISVLDILKFLHCTGGRRMHQAAQKNLLKKEQPFVLGVDAAEIYPGEESTEIILVQGIIDAYFEENGELVVLDYKTDKVKSGLELKEKYHAQLDYYAKALEQLLGKKVKEKIIYSFTLGEEIQV
ncbi:helicase-exonuclease AddAB subunit AddA [Faecalicatena contorta]|uniref:ATP-dependent helicase/nuclease subunit A n=1 Tax=Faecalicatena contorta TaxID=39482 RepID=A0A316A0X9_9FIRM|nr:helicase-exonuclease AddAB subunit AddA [Faecalicatena contorta]PWJ51501.1 DNA helicase/exodeoxyribonuclease V subunit A [Faecalicatena contorta]SUQ13057.1 DNA helicase/exodeoxyribonuclease V, subunit A [Faecalicatena contorta]